MKKTLTAEQIAEIRRLRQGGMSYCAIGRIVGCADVTARKYAEDVVPEGTLVCPDCGQELPPQARFCFMCGTKILTEREQLIERAAKMRSVFNLLPENTRDTTMQTINDVIAYLEKEAS